MQKNREKENNRKSREKFVFLVSQMRALPPSGLFYVPDFLDESVKLQQEIDGLPWSPLTIRVDTGRLVQQYGARFDYEDYDHLKSAPGFPHGLNQLRIKTMKYIDNLPIPIDQRAKPLEQCIVNNYMTNQRISPHIDHKIFGPVIACVSIGDKCVMRFTRANEIYDVTVEPNSLYVMSGECRTQWKHEMLPERETNYRRISVTFRSIV